MTNLQNYAEEIWKDIHGYEGRYQVSNLGRVKSLARKWRTKETILANTNTFGYFKVNLCKNGIISYAKVHRLVAESFIPNPNNYPQINHIDSNRANSHVYNLEWCTCSQNNLHAYRTGMRKSAYGFAKLNPSDILIIRNRLKNGEKSRVISESYNVHSRTILSIKNGTTWSHIP